jgi:signal peptidase II
VAAVRAVFGLLAIAVFILDRVTKSLVEARVPFGTEVPVIGHLVGITNVHNSGAAFGLVPALAGLFLIASAAVAIGLVVYVARTSVNLWTGAVLGLILGGTIGNGFDRLVFGTVTDFVNVHFWPVFNVADSAISIGVVALIATYLLRKPSS